MNHENQKYSFGIDFSAVPPFPSNPTELPKYHSSFKNLIKVERDKIKQFHRAGAGGREVVQAHTSLVDSILCHLIESLTSREKYSSETILEEFSLIAVGGYGRGELNPYSDIDLLFLTSKNIRRSTDKLIQEFIPIFWDLGMEVGSSCRTIQECLMLAEKDITIKTSMIETRFMMGNQTKYQKFFQAINKNGLKKNTTRFLNAKSKEKLLRYTEGIGPSSNPEPNVKEDVGGLRDYHTALWAIAIRFGCLSFREIPRDDIVSSEELNILNRSIDFTLRVRNELHYIVNKKQDILTHNLQKKVSGNLGYREANEVLRVEEFMCDYFTHATNIHQYSEIIFQRCIETRRSIKKVISLLTKKNLGYGFHASGENLIMEEKDPDALFKQTPSLILNIFELCQAHNLIPNYQIKRLIKKHSHLLSEVLLIKNKIKPFIFNTLKNTNSEKHLRLMHEVGLLGLILPEYGRAHCKVSYDFYHRYTADEHSLRMVRFLEELESKPIEFNEIAINYSRLQDKTLLKLSTFIQPTEENTYFDAPNGSFKNILPAIKHIDLNPKELKIIKFLASNAYLMIETALHSDINQPAVIEQFAKKVKSIEKLDLLFLRSYSELRAVAPGTLTSWKKVLLSELYQRSCDYLKHPESLHSRSLTTWVEVYKILHWEFPPEDLEFHFNNLPDDYLETVKVEEAALHMRLTRSLKNKSFIFNHYYNAEGKFHQVTLCCLTKFDAFKTLVGALTAQNINILEAKIFVRKDGIIIISANIEQSERLTEDNLAVWKNLKQDLKSIFEGQKSLQKILINRTRYALKEKPIKLRTSKVVIDNTSDSNFSIVRIEAQDHIGMLYKISKVFADFKIQIHSAKISTQGGLGIDVFYISLQQKKLLLDNIIRRMQEEIKLVMIVQRPEDID
jgi:[protein-PII] uridylyltransferase